MNDDAISVNREFGAPVKPTSVPLTAMQKAWLLKECLPLVFFVVVLGAYLTVLRGIFGEPSIPFLLLMGVVLFAVGHRAVQRLRDLFSGAARVQEDVLERVWRPRYSGGGRRNRYGEFATLGRMMMMPKPFMEGGAGQRYRVVYSPASRVVWALEPV
jgi:hypothetical protein